MSHRLELDDLMKHASQHLAEQHPAEAQAVLTPGRERYALFVLMLIYAFGYLDRQVVNILAEPIKNELLLSDSELGLLTGLAFALFYTLLGLPVARLADRFDRSRIISASLFLWSTCTALSGLASSYAALLLLRIGVGVGEAGCNPPATSLIADVVPRSRRASAMSVFALGNPIGSLLGLAVGGIVAATLGWRAAFLIAGLPGIALAALAWFTLPEPRRKRDVTEITPTIGDAFREFGGKPTFWLLGLGAAMMAFVHYGNIAFYSSFFLRNHAAGLASSVAWAHDATGINLPPLALLGIALGLVMGVFGALGIVAGGRIADRVGALNPAAYMNAPFVAAAAQVPFCIMGLFVENVWLAVGLFCVPAFLTTIWFGPVMAVATGLVGPRVRSTSGAMMQLVINLIGLGLGPLSIGILSDAIAVAGSDSGESLRFALAASSTTGLLAALCFFLARRHIARDMIN